MAITIDRDTAKDLITSKLDNIEFAIQEILSKWNQSDPSTFLELAKQGDLPEESIRDGIAMRQLILDQEKYQNMLREKLE